MGLLSIWRKVATPVDPAVLQEQFFEAAQSGEIARVKKLLKQGADIHADNERALKDAWTEERWQMVEALLDKGADATALPGTPLEKVLRKGRTDLAEKLINGGLQPDMSGGAGDTLKITLDHSNTDALKWVLKQPGMRNHPKLNAYLEKAFDDRRFGKANALMQHGADPTVLSIDPMHIAISRGAIWMAQDLKKHGVMLNSSPGTQNSLTVAMGQSSSDMIKWVAEQPEMQDHPDLNTLLERAFEDHQLNKAEILMKNGADPTALSIDPMHIAISRGAIWMARGLKKRGVELNSTPGKQNSLTVAMGQSSGEMIKWVAEQPEMQDHPDLNTLLEHAFKDGQLNKAKTLMEKGADPNAITTDPMHVAISRGMAWMAQDLKKRGVSLNTGEGPDNSLLVALDQSSTDMMKWVLKQPEIDPHFGNEQPLCTAFAKQRWGIVHNLLDNGADAAQLPGDPMQTVAGDSFSGTGLLKKLQKAGLQIDRVTNGRTPLIAAVEAGNMDRVNWLLEQGADPSRLNSTALVRAVEKKRKKIAVVLLEKGADGTPVLGMELEDTIRKMAEENALKASAGRTAQMHRIRRTHARTPRP